MSMPDGFWLVVVAIVGLVTVGWIARLLGARWLPDADAPMRVTLAVIPVMAAFLAAIHAMALGRMCAWLSSMPLSVIAVLFVGLCGLAVALLSHEGVTCRRSPVDVRTGGRVPGGWLVLVPVVAVHGLLLFEGMTRHPVGHDALKYHLPMAVQWLRHDAMVMFPEVWEFSLPGNGELITWWLLKSGIERLASVAYLPAGWLLAGAVWAIVRSVRGSRFAGLLAVATVLSTHLVVFQMYSSYIDLFGTAFLTAAIAALLMASRWDCPARTRRMLVLLGGLAIGIALGTKPVNWPLGLAVAVAFAAVHLYRMRRRHDLAFLLPVFAAACGMCSLFWFTRAVVHTGNPFYPIQVKVAGEVILPGVDLGWTCNAPIWSRLDSLRGGAGLMADLARYTVTLDAKSGGVGPVFTMLVPLGVLGLMVGLVLRGRRMFRHERWVMVLLTVVVFAVWVGAIRHYGRFGMLYLVLAVCTAVPLVGWAARWWPRFVLASATLAVGLACVVVSREPADRLIGRWQDGGVTRAAFYGLPDVIDELPPGARVLNVTRKSGKGLTYPLYGEDLSNDVLDAMTTRQLFPELKPSMEALRALGVEYVFACEPYEEGWSAEGELELVYDGSADPDRPERVRPCRLYRVPEAPSVPAAQVGVSGFPEGVAGWSLEDDPAPGGVRGSS